MSSDEEALRSLSKSKAIEPASSVLAEARCFQWGLCPTKQVSCSEWGTCYGRKEEGTVLEKTWMSRNKHCFSWPCNGWNFKNHIESSIHIYKCQNKYYKETGSILPLTCMHTHPVRERERQKCSFIKTSLYRKKTKTVDQWSASSLSHPDPRTPTHTCISLRSLAGEERKESWTQPQPHGRGMSW